MAQIVRDVVQYKAQVFVFLLQTPLLRMNATCQRAIVKSVTWQLVSLVLGVSLAYIFLHNWGQAIELFIVNMGAELLLMFLHELVWQRVRWPQGVTTPIHAWDSDVEMSELGFTDSEEGEGTTEGLGHAEEEEKGALPTLPPPPRYRPIETQSRCTQTEVQTESKPHSWTTNCSQDLDLGVSAAAYASEVRRLNSGLQPRISPTHSRSADDAEPFERSSTPSSALLSQTASSSPPQVSAESWSQSIARLTIEDDSLDATPVYTSRTPSPDTVSSRPLLRTPPARILTSSSARPSTPT